MCSEVDSNGFVDEAGVVDGRVTSGGHGRNFDVVRLIAGRVVSIEDSDGELSELEELSVDSADDVDEISVDSTDEVDGISEVISPPVDKSVKDDTDVTSLSIVVVEPSIDASVDPAVDSVVLLETMTSVVLLKSRTSIVVDE